MGKHTPGPWRFTKALDICGDLGKKGEISIATILDVAWPNGNRQEDPRANARLIAAAPEMLEALQKLDKLFTENPQAFNANISQVQLAYEVIQEALKKAEGGE